VVTFFYLFGVGILLTLASARLTLLLTTDTILDRPRDWIFNRSVFFTGLLSCNWCAAPWVATPLYVTWAYVHFYQPDWETPYLFALALPAIWYITSIAADLRN